MDGHTGASLFQVQATGAFQRYRATAVGGDGGTVRARLANPPAWVGGEKQSASPEGEGKGVDDQRGRDVSENTEAREKFSSDASLLQKANGGERGVHDGWSFEGKGDENSDNSRGIFQGDGTTADRSDPDGWKRRREQQRWPRLAPKQRQALKRALAALWNSENDRGGQSSDAPDGGEAILVRGGLKASELSATIYGTTEALCELGARGDDWGGGAAGLDGEDSDGVRRFECSVEDCEEILLELEAEEMEARRLDGQMDGRSP